ncbi:hypothetical protein B9Z55_004575 [Caenorhabditis nigoni]|uniref:Uncharacterized protein n=1 Tax=Caenorhabditis nigoni TaxID=1611254 RepID=A0A2G5UX12_9PELO|nr:hypothetical protein B9Z55_004575 [Caenorhabditis nigoni]
MASSLDNHLDQDGMCSVYSMPPSETNCSISEVLAKEIIAVNEVSDDHAEMSIYSAPKSETNVTISDVFRPCPDVQEFAIQTAHELTASVYSVPKSETNVTLGQKFQRCGDLAKVLDYSIYTTPLSETNVTMPEAPFSYSEYTALKSETDVTMADFRAIASASEYTAKPADAFFDNTAYVEHLQVELGIPDSKVIGLECSNMSIAKIIDSNECLMKLESFVPVPVDFEQMPEPSTYNLAMQATDKSVESYLLHSSNASSIHHEI